MSGININEALGGRVYIPIVRRVDPPTSEASGQEKTRCTTCNEVKPLTGMYFREGLVDATCRECCQEMFARENELRRQLAEMTRERDELFGFLDRINVAISGGHSGFESCVQWVREVIDTVHKIDDCSVPLKGEMVPLWIKEQQNQLVRSQGLTQAAADCSVHNERRADQAERERDELRDSLQRISNNLNEPVILDRIKHMDDTPLNRSYGASHLCKELAQTRQGFTELGEKYDVAKRQLEWLEKQLHGSDGYIATARELRVEIGERAKERDAEAVRADAAIAEANDARTKLAAAEAEAAARGEFLDELNEITCHKSWHASVKFVRDVLSDHQAIRGNLKHELIQERSKHLVDTLVNRSYAAFMVIRDLLQEKNTLEADSAAMREALQACLNYMGESPEFGHCDKLEQRIVDVLNGTAGRELLERLKKLESENAEWRRLHEALLLQCGHLRSSIVTSIESNSNWCGECDMHSRLSDAIQMEKHNKEQWDREKERRVYYQNIVYSVCNLLDKHFGYTPGQGIVTGTVETPSTMVADTLEKVLFRCRQLDTAEADAAAMRENVHEVVNEFRKLEAMEGNDPIRCSRMHFGDWADQLLEPTAGRELLDRHKAELAAKDAEIEHLRALNASQAEGLMNDRDAAHKLSIRFQRKCRTAKAALVEHYRGKIDPAWFGEKSELYKYRTTDNPFGLIWRTSDGQSCEAAMVGHGWITATAYSSWQECCDDKRTYPCHADGTPLEKSDADMLRKLREWIRNGVFTVVGNSVVIGCQCVPTELAELLIAIRDGGAK